LETQPVDKCEKRRKNMKSHKMFVVGIVLAMVFSSAATAWARDFPVAHRGHGFGPGLAGLKIFLELKPSESQQVEMMNIFTKYRNEEKSLRESMVEARKNISTALDAEKFNEEQAREAFRKSSAVREELFVLRARMMSELKAVLTAEQAELLKDRKARRIERIKHRFDALLESGSE
jgi:Spy/CpxP family protein refolding chaperone